MSKKRMLDGYCAQNKGGDWMLASCCYDSFHATSILHDQLDAAGQEQEDEGWQIKPVRIIDASDDSTEVVLPRSLFTELHTMLSFRSEGWAKELVQKLEEVELDKK